MTTKKTCRRSLLLSEHAVSILCLYQATFLLYNEVVLLAPHLICNTQRLHEFHAGLLQTSVPSLTKSIARHEVAHSIFCFCLCVKSTLPSLTSSASGKQPSSPHDITTLHTLCALLTYLDTEHHHLLMTSGVGRGSMVVQSSGLSLSRLSQLADSFSAWVHVAFL